MHRLKKFLTEETAATSVEYAVMLAMILMGCIVAIGTVGASTLDLWASNDSGLQSAFNP